MTHITGNREFRQYASCRGKVSRPRSVLQQCVWAHLLPNASSTNPSYPSNALGVAVIERQAQVLAVLLTANCSAGAGNPRGDIEALSRIPDVRAITSMLFNI